MSFHRRSLGMTAYFGSIALALTCSFRALAVTEYATSEIPFTKDLSDFKASLTPSVQDELEKISIPIKKLRLRINNPKKDPTIEAVAITVPRSETGISAYAEKIAANGKAEKFTEILLAKIKKSGPTNKESVRLELGPEDLPYLNLKALAKDLAKEHHLVTVNTRDLMASSQGWDEMKGQLSYLLSKEQMSRIHKKIRNGLDLSLQEDLLPPFSKRMAGKFIVYKGPNCFHASLSFYDQQLPKSPEVNIKEEEGYHRSMINYDELWRVINSQFYEIDPKRSAMKYGDLMVYFQAPEGPIKSINFKWIRHASVYLFGPYTYSKGSKSPSTPYSVKTLAEEWGTWKTMVPNLSVKVYRRDADAEISIPQDRDDWMY